MIFVRHEHIKWSQIPLHDFQVLFHFCVIPISLVRFQRAPNRMKCMQIGEEGKKPNQLIISFRIRIADLLNWNESKNEDAKKQWRATTTTKKKRKERIYASDGTKHKTKQKCKQHKSQWYLCVKTNHSCNCRKSQIAYDTSYTPKCRKQQFEQRTMQRIKIKKEMVVVVMCFQCCRHSFAE